MELSAIRAPYERELRGKPPHDPQMMTTLLLYGYCVGVPSSRKIERKTHEDVGFRIIAGGTHPDHSTISEFRRVHLSALSALFVQVLQLCQKAGLVKLGQVAIDGTKLKANASKHKAMSYDRMVKNEEELAAKVAELLAAAERVDADEDARYGKNRHGDELPEQLQRAQTRLARIRELKAELEAEAKAQHETRVTAKATSAATDATAAAVVADGAGADAGADAADNAGAGTATAAVVPDDDGDEPPAASLGNLPTHQIPTDKAGTPTPKAQRNFTDPESRIMKSGDGFVQGWNCQIAVDAAHQIIVAQAVTNQPPDVEHLMPLLHQTVANCDAVPAATLGDAGYFSEKNVAAATALGTDPFLATGRLKRGEPPPVVQDLSPDNNQLTAKQQMARKLAAPEGASIYARRKAIVEPVFGQIKGARGLRAFLLRGVTKVRGEWSLMTLCHNLLKLHRVAQPA